MPEAAPVRADPDAELRADLAETTLDTLIDWMVITPGTTQTSEIVDAVADALIKGPLATLRAERDQFAAGLSKARDALRPFAAEKLPSLRRTERDYDRAGLRRMMSPMEIACKRASEALALTPDPHQAAGPSSNGAETDG